MLPKRKFSKNAIVGSSSNDSSYDSLKYMPSSPQVAPATVAAVQSGGNPSILNRAKEALGNQDYIGLCEKFVEATQGATGKFVSAIDAWNKTPNKVTSLDGIKPGDAIYFAPDKSNSGYGHTGVYSGNGSMISATNSGVKETPLNSWIKSTGQQVLGFIPK